MAQVSAAKSQDRGMKESFAALLEESLGTSESLEGTVVKGTVLNIENDMVLIDVGLKSEGRVALKEFAVPGQPVELKIGDTVEVYLERMEDKHGEAMLSREKAKREEAWTQLERAFTEQQRVTGIIFGRDRMVIMVKVSLTSQGHAFIESVGPAAKGAGTDGRSSGTCHAGPDADEAF